YQYSHSVHTIIYQLLCPPPISPLFPYTTLFRSHGRHAREIRGSRGERQRLGHHVVERQGHSRRLEGQLPGVGDHRLCDVVAVERSEEHTSELQSRFDLVCRLLLEKKNQSLMMDI